MNRCDGIQLTHPVEIISGIFLSLRMIRIRSLSVLRSPESYFSYWGRKAIVFSGRDIRFNFRFIIIVYIVMNWDKFLELHRKFPIWLVKTSLNIFVNTVQKIFNSPYLKILIDFTDLTINVNFEV